LLWAPPRKTNPTESPEVKVAYERMARVLSALAVAPDGSVFVDGTPVDSRLVGYYRPYVKIEQYLKSNPDNIKGVYEVVWDNGGGGRQEPPDPHAFGVIKALASARGHSFLCCHLYPHQYASKMPIQLFGERTCFGWDVETALQLGFLETPCDRKRNRAGQ
jgi:hypothetical protein